MSRHATVFELAEVAAGRGEHLNDAAYIARHVRSCETCALSLRGMRDPLGAEMPPHHPPPEPGLRTTGYLYLPAFDPRVHPEPEMVLPVVAASNITTDPITNLPVVRIMNLHDRRAMAARGDLFTTESDCAFDGWVVCLWSMREICADRLTDGELVGCLGSATYNLVRSYAEGKPLPDSEQVAHGVNGGALDPAVVLRKRLTLDFGVLTADLDARRALKLRVLDTVAECLPALGERDEPEAYAGIYEILVAALPVVARRARDHAIVAQLVSEVEQATAALAGPDQFGTDQFQRLCGRVAATTPVDRDRLMLLMLLAAENYVRTGLPDHCREAERLIRQYLTT